MRSGNSNPHKIGLYIRVSTEEQASNPEGSIKSQEQRLRQHVEYKNQDGNFGRVDCVYIDRAKSGADFNRPQLQRLLSDIRNKKVTMVLVTEISRLSRSLKDFCHIWDMMREYGCDFQSLREQFDSTTAARGNGAIHGRKYCAVRASANFRTRASQCLGPLPAWSLQRRMRTDGLQS